MEELDIEYLTHVPSIEEINEDLTIPVQNWVDNTFEQLNKVQRISIPRIIREKSTLVMAPTGAGKTLAAFLGIINELQHREENNELEEKIYALYVSPLKALNNDIHKNLEIPLEEIKQESGSHISAAKRTGDTTRKERQHMLHNPPHILITTPESLALMLASPKFKKNLRYIEWLIIDEIHSIANNKRGSLLSLCVERLAYYLNKSITRIGLSATVEPVETIAHYLMGNREAQIGIIDRGGIREVDLEVITPVRNLVRAPFSLIEDKHIDYLKEYTENHETTLIFTNTRHLAERLVYDLIEVSNKEYKDKIAVHHGSLDKEVRFDVENRLKRGEMKAVFSSTSLELGIDIGSIDITIQLGSPKTVRSLLQRIGRSGHSQGLTSKGKLLVFNRDDLIESTAIAKLAIDGDIDAITIPKNPVDVLIQMIVGMAVEKKWEFEEAYNVINKAYPYRSLSIDRFLEIIRQASDPTGDKHSWKYQHIWVDEDINEFGRRKSARQAYLQNIGTIPDTTTIDVVLQGFRTTIGQIAERFAERLQDGDIFILGGKTYEFVRAVGNKVIVKDAMGKIPTVPSWGGEAQSRTWEVSNEISVMLEKVDQLVEKDKQKAIDWLIDRYPIGTDEAGAIVDYIIEQRGVAPIPTMDHVIVEGYSDPSGAFNILVLAIFGLETNQALAQILASLLSRKLDHNIGMISTDNGFLLRIPPGIDYDHTEVLKELYDQPIEKIIRRSLRGTEMFKLRFRHCAARALMILRKWGKKNISVNQQRSSARWLLKSLPSDYPVIDETFREILYDSYNLNTAKQVINKLELGDIETSVLPVAEVPSSMTHDLLLNGELDVVMMENKRNLLLSLHQQVLSRVLPELEDYGNILDPEEVGQYFSEKLTTGKVENRIRKIASYPKYLDQPISTGAGLISIDEDQFRDLVEQSDDIVFLPNGNITTIQLLPYFGATDPQLWEHYDTEDDPKIVKVYRRSKEISPDIGWQELVINYLQFAGPQTLKNIASALNTTSERLKPVLQLMQRKNEVLSGHFISEEQEYLLLEDREQLRKITTTTKSVTKENLRDFRLYKMRLINRDRSTQIDIPQYLKQHGPARDPLEILARIDSFNWLDLRGLLADKEVFFGRFLGRRLVFVHRDQLPVFIRITREKEKLEGFEYELLALISEVPGLTKRELTRRTKKPSSKIKESLKLLEQELYISRIGLDLTLTHGGFPDPKYVAIPHFDNLPTYEEAVQQLLTWCLSWYGPLKLEDLLRITRLPYPVVENAMDNVEDSIIQQRILNSLYYGFEDDFKQLGEFTLTNEESKKFQLLSPLDPFFYMTSGSFRQQQLPRQTRISIVQGGMPKGYVEIAIPDKDILQIINLQMKKRDLRDFDLVQAIGVKLRELGKNAYKTPVIYIEEINYKAANHEDNAAVVTILEEIGYQLHVDHLVMGTGRKTEYSIQDVIETRQLSHKITYQEQFSDIDKLFGQYTILPQSKIMDILDIPLDRAKLLISNYLRKGKIYYHNNKFYRADIYKALFGRDKDHTNAMIRFLEKPKSLNQVAKHEGIDKKEANKLLTEFLKNGTIQVVSPYSKSIEYRAVPLNDIDRKKQITLLLTHFISSKGPLTFSKLLDLVDSYMEISRTELLVLLVELLKHTDISSASIRDSKGNKQIMYFTVKHGELLGNPARSQQFETWKIYSSEDGIFDQVDVEGSQIIVYRGQPIASFEYTIDVDKAEIENIWLQQEALDDTIDKEILVEMVNQVEQHLLNQDVRTMKVNMIQSAYPSYWFDL